MTVAAVRKPLIEALETRLMLARLVGIDVSHFQVNVNWATVKNVGQKDFAFIRATRGADFLDTEFEKNMDGLTGAKAQGLMVGFYHFARYDLLNPAATE